MRNVVGLGLIVSLVVGCGAASKSAEPASPSTGAAGYGGGSSPAASAPAEESVAPGAQPAPPPPSAPMSASAPSGGSAKKSEAVASADKADRADSSPRAAEPAKPTTPIAKDPPRPTPPLPQAGQLTAGVWDDNKNFDFWKPYLQKMTARSQDNSMFNEQELVAARTESLAQQTPHNELDVQLLLDTTGSMGDELEYLQSEFDAIAAQLKTRFPNVTPRWSLVVYRDHGDEYVTRAFDFTADTARFRQNLRAQSAGGGGDTPEAVVEGMTKGLAQSWRTANNVAKVSFWVADAPAHPGEGRALAAAVRDAKKKGVHVYPVASSDTDDTAEYQMRATAQMTGGRYVFLTNDSGVGNSHAEPHIPCYNVTRLDHAIVRMISVELSGRYVEAESNQLVRQVGRPNKDGKCQLSSGMLVASF
jgi:hypothetical protein